MTDDMWGTGDYKAVGNKVSSIGQILVQRAAIEPGMEVLDVACGAGNATIPAARRGARVTGLDFSPACSRPHANAAPPRESTSNGSRATPRPCHSKDHRFDRVISSIGHMFAPDSWRCASATSPRRQRLLRPSQ
ncbi:MAG: class I SAM-dependent methyltransferase [Mycobacterium sp.]